jgi:hypothetical protein
MAQAAVQVYELDYYDESQGFFFALGEQMWNFGPWSSDAQVLYCRIEKEKLAHLVVIGGTQVAWQGQPLLKAPASAFFEWRRQDAVMNTTPGGFFITSLFEELTDGSCSSSADPSNRNSSHYAEKH